MPFESDKQRRFMHAQHPEIAERWEHEAQERGTPAVRKGGELLPHEAAFAAQQLQSDAAPFTYLDATPRADKEP